MAKSNSDNTTPRWQRSATTGTLVGVRFQEEDLAKVDLWAEKQDPKTTRPEAIRRLVDVGLKAKR